MKREPEHFIVADETLKEISTDNDTIEYILPEVIVKRCYPE